MLKVPPLNVKHFSTADAWLKQKFQVAGRTTFCQLFAINFYVIGAHKLPVAGVIGYNVPLAIYWVSRNMICT